MAHRGLRVLLSGIFLLFVAPPARGQTSDPPPRKPPIEEIIVVGTAIQRTPIDSPYAVSVVDREALEQQGSPLMVDLFKNLGVSQGVVGERSSWYGSVKFSGRVADLADEKRHAELPWISIPARDHQPRRMAVPSILCELSRCRRSPGPTRHHGVLRSDPALVHPVRLGIRSQAQASTGPAGRHMAPGRGLRHHPGTAALSLACRRSRWRRHRHPRPVASRPPGCQTLYPQAVEGSGE